MFRRLNKAQSTAEYAIVIGLVIAAAVAMQIYVRRGLSGRVKDAVDNVNGAGIGSADSATIFQTRQYDPEYATSVLAQTRSANETEAVAKGGSVTRTTTSDVSSRKGTMDTGVAKKDDYGAGQ